MWLLLLTLLKRPSRKAAFLREAVRNTLTSLASQFLHPQAAQLITLEQRITYARALADARMSLQLAMQMEATGLARVRRRHSPRPHRFSQSSAAPELDQLASSLMSCIAMLEAGPALARALAGRLTAIAREVTRIAATRPASSRQIAQTCAASPEAKARPPPRAGP